MNNNKEADNSSEVVIELVSDGNVEGLRTALHCHSKLQELQEQANAGNATAQLELGLCYQRGYGVDMDNKLASNWIVAASMQGNQTATGFCLFNGYETTEDKKRAFACFSEGAKDNQPDAINMLGHCYFIGSGTTQDYSKAYKLFSTAAEMGSTSALNNMGHCLLIGRGTSSSPESAYETFLKAATKGAVVAQFNVGWCLEYGKGVALSFDKALDWYKFAARQGHQDSIQSVRRLVSIFSQLKKREWKRIRLLHIARLKNHYSTCPMAALPKEVLRYIVSIFLRVEYYL